MPSPIAVGCAVVALVVACGRSEPAPLPAAAANAQASESSGTAPTIVVSATGREALKIEIDRDKIEVRAGSRHIVGQTKGDKRFYHRGSMSGEAFVEVKISDAGFKVRTPDSTLLWKIKLADDKIKVSDNEENLSAWTLKTHYDDKVKVEDPAEHEVGEVRFNAESGKIKIKNAADSELFVLASGKRSAAYGVLLMSGIPEQYRDVIIAELLARGR